MYNTLLEAGNQVSIFSEFKEERKYEGEAILLERLEIGDTFFIDEFVASNPAMDFTPNKRKEAFNEKLNEVFNNLSVQTRSAKKFFIQIMKLRCNKLNDYNNMLKCVYKWKDELHKEVLLGKYDNDDRFKRILREVPSKFIVRYFQQYNKKVNNSIFRYEKWLVEFIIDEQGGFTSYKAAKKIRVIVKNNYREKNGFSELSLLTTYNGKAYKRKKAVV